MEWPTECIKAVPFKTNEQTAQSRGTKENKKRP